MNTSAFRYAVEQTRVLYVPDRRIDSFGETNFNFRLLSEPMDSVGQCRIRSGTVEAHRPRIIRPSDLTGVELEGFTPQAAQFFEWMKSRGIALRALLRYGFRFTRTAVHEELVHEDIREVGDRLAQEALHSGDAFRAVILGIDDAWEASLLRFMIEMIQQSNEINVFDYKRRGLI